MDKLESKAAYLRRRKRRVRELYLEGQEAVDIAVALVAEETIETTDESMASAIRLVRIDIAEIRAATTAQRAEDVKPDQAGDEVDSLARKLKRLREAFDAQQLIADGQPTEMCARSRYPPDACQLPECAVAGHQLFVGPAIGVTMTDTPQGMMTSYRALWPAGVRQKARKDAATLAEKIAEVEVAMAAKRAAMAEKVAGIGADGGGLTIVESDKSIDELIAENLSVN